MANLSAPPVFEQGDFSPLPDDEMLETIVVGLEEVPNNFFNPATDDARKATQLMWEFAIVEEGEFKGRKVRHWTSAYFSRHAKAKLAPMVAKIDPDFSIDVAYPGGIDEMKSKVMYRPVRILVENKTVEKMVDGEKKEYTNSKIVKFAETKRSKDKVDPASVGLSLGDSGTHVPVEVSGDDIPF